MDRTDLTRTIRTRITPCACGCWIWTGSLDSNHYGKVKLKGHTVIVHRYVWNKANPDRPVSGYDETIDHLCHNTRRCVCPDHMEVVTRSVNSTRANTRRWHDDRTKDCDSCETCVLRQLHPNHP